MMKKTLLFLAASLFCLAGQAQIVTSKSSIIVSHEEPRQEKALRPFVDGTVIAVGNVEHDTGSPAANVGVTAGAFGKWGFYGRLLFDVADDDGGPTVIGGVIKGAGRHVFFNLGLGYSTLRYTEEDYHYGYYGGYYSEEDYTESGLIFDAGMSFNFGHFNFGFSINPAYGFESEEAYIGYGLSLGFTF